MKITGKRFFNFTSHFNQAAAVAVVLMMLLTTADVVMRAFGHPIPGTYEIVGMLGSLIISLSLANTSVEKGHIAVEFLVAKFPQKVQDFINAVNSVIALVFFMILTWQCMVYGTELLKSGEVSPTVQLPVYPFIYGLAAGSFILCIELLIEIIQSCRNTGDV